MQLDNPRHESFAANCAAGMSQAEAYRKVYEKPGKKLKNPRSQASDLLRDNPDISARVAELSAQSGPKAAMSAATMMDWLTAVLTTAPDDVDGSSPLAQEVIRTDKGVRVVMANKLRAAELLAKIANMITDRLEVIDKTPREPLHELKARVTEALGRHSRS